MPVGVEEGENLTVTGNASITTRSLWVTLLAAILALAFVVTSAEDADARRVRNKKSTAAFVDTFTPPDQFSCGSALRGKQLDQRVDGYSCTAATTTFLLNDVLTRGDNPPPGPGLAGVAIPPPALFECHAVNAPSLPPGQTGRGAILAEHVSCKYRHNQQTRVFKVNEIVSTNLDEVADNGEVTENPDDLEDLFLPPVGRALPSAVPAGADAAGEGSARGA